MVARVCRVREDTPVFVSRDMQVSDRYSGVLLQSLRKKLTLKTIPYLKALIFLSISRRTRLPVQQERKAKFYSFFAYVLLVFLILQIVLSFAID